VPDVALFSQKMSVQASYHMFAAGSLARIHVHGYRFAHPAPVHRPVKPVVNIRLFPPDKKSIITDKHFVKNEAISRGGGETPGAGQYWLSTVIQVIISVSP
jgi:hypothetical protein